MSERREIARGVALMVGGFVKWVGLCLLAMASIWLAYSAVAFLPLLLAAAVIYALATRRR